MISCCRCGRWRCIHSGRLAGLGLTPALPLLRRRFAAHQLRGCHCARVRRGQWLQHARHGGRARGAGHPAHLPHVEAGRSRVGGATAVGGTAASLEAGWVGARAGPAVGHCNITEGRVGGSRVNRGALGHCCITGGRVGGARGTVGLCVTARPPAGAPAEDAGPCLARIPCYACRQVLHGVGLVA